MVLEAAGEDEAEAGKPTVGRAGQYLWQQVARVGLQREDFRIHNVLSCRPPGNKLVGMPYEQAAVAHCAPNLNATIADMKERCRLSGKQMVIVALGVPAFKRIMGLRDHDPMLKADYLCYPHWSDVYNCWVFAADHPSYIMRGNHSLANVLQWVFQRAVEVASEGLVWETTDYLCDPTAETFGGWVDAFLSELDKNPELILSYDIETPMKSGADEEKVAREDDDDYTILRCSFAYQPGMAVSIPWQPEYTAHAERLFASRGFKLGWNLNYDSPRVRAQMPILGQEIDAMLAWHVLNSALPKGLGFVTPFYNKRAHMWKHESDSRPAYYNAADADFALRNYVGIRNDLVKNKQWHIFERHIIRLNEVLSYMSGVGLLRDEKMRQEAETKLTALLNVVEAEIDAAVPKEARSVQVYKKVPKSTDGLIQVRGRRNTKQCNRCGATDIKAAHFKAIGKKAAKEGRPENPCFGAAAIKTEVDDLLWAKYKPWAISNQSLQVYQKVMGHQPIKERKTGRITFDVNAMKKLVMKYPADALYPLISRQRKYDKLRGTYIGVSNPDGSIRGGLPVGRDLAVHTLFNHNPETLRLASQNPNLQNLPRPTRNKEDLQNVIRNLFVARAGHLFVARDFSGIEAVLVGYEARSARYIRLSKMDVHSFYTAYALHALDGRIAANDLPELSWDDSRLARRLAEIKSEFSHDRNSLYKHLTHAINFGQGPKGAQEKIFKETDVIHNVNTIGMVMGVYKELFPEIVKWQNDMRLQADAEGFLRNAFGYSLRFNRVFAWKMQNGQWVKELGDDAQAVLAFKPQSNAAGIMKEALLRLYFDWFEEAGQWLRLTVHDEIFGEPPSGHEERFDELLKLEMERAIPEMPLPPSWNMGTHLNILTEGKRGLRWGSMK